MIKVLAILALIGGIIIVAGIFLPWTVSTRIYENGTENVEMYSGWELARGEGTGGDMTWLHYPDVILAGGVMVMVAALLMLITGKLGLLRALLATGAFFPVGYTWFHFLSASTTKYDYTGWLGGGYTSTSGTSYGMFVVFIGAVLVLISLFGLIWAKEEETAITLEAPTRSTTAASPAIR